MATVPTPLASTTTSAHAPYLQAPLQDLAAWTRYFRDAQIPVLAKTSRALEVLRADQDNVDASMLAATMEGDPLMTLKLLAYVAGQRRPGTFTETESVTTSLLMTGVAPFFRGFGLQATVEDHLHDQPAALEGLRALLRRAERAAHFAVGFAVHRGDTDVGPIRLAAFLHDFAEMLMWCHAPTLQLRITAAQRADPALRTVAVQRDVLHIELDDLRQALMKLWHLPELLVRISDDRHADQAIVRNVVLAVRLARHSTYGWDNPALPDDMEEIAQLLHVLPRVAQAYVHKIDPTA
ncbi:MAG: HDOD domain-containing protein [Pseudomonadota bacterium]